MNSQGASRGSSPLVVMTALVLAQKSPRDSLVRYDPPQDIGVAPDPPVDPEEDEVVTILGHGFSVGGLYVGFPQLSSRVSKAT